MDDLMKKIAAVKVVNDEILEAIDSHPDELVVFVHRLVFVDDSYRLKVLRKYLQESEKLEEWRFRREFDELMLGSNTLWLDVRNSMQSFSKFRTLNCKIFESAREFFSLFDGGNRNVKSVEALRRFLTNMELLQVTFGELYQSLYPNESDIKDIEIRIDAINSALDKLSSTVTEPSLKSRPRFAVLNNVVQILSSNKSIDQSLVNEIRDYLIALNNITSLDCSNITNTHVFAKYPNLPLEVARHIEEITFQSLSTASYPKFNLHFNSEVVNSEVFEKFLMATSRYDDNYNAPSFEIAVFKIGTSYCGWCSEMNANDNCCENDILQADYRYNPIFFRIEGGKCVVKRSERTLLLSTDSVSFVALEEDLEDNDGENDSGFMYEILLGDQSSIEADDGEVLEVRSTDSLLQPPLPEYGRPMLSAVWLLYAYE